MKRAVFAAFCGVLVVVFSPCVYSQDSQVVSLDEAIISAGKVMENGLKPGTKVAILNFNSDTPAFSNHVIEELIDYLTNSKKLVVVERAQLNLVMEEMMIQLSGYVSDESAQRIGQHFAAQAIISGSFADVGTEFRFRLYSINVENLIREPSTSIKVKRDDSQVRFLLTGQTNSVGTEKPVQTENSVTESPVQPSEIPTKVEAVTYTIGDTGPAGGIVFYDKGSFSNGWRYLEAAPVEIEFSAKWSTSRKDVKTQTATGSGKNNTKVILEQLKKDKEEDMAAQQCAEIDFDGIKDWFIPSKDELDILYKNLKLKNIGGLGSGKYASSSQKGKVNVWFQDFTTGRQKDFSKDEAYIVRVIRSF